MFSFNWHKKWSPSYDRLDEQEKFLHDDEPVYTMEKTPWRSRTLDSLRFLTVINIVILAASVFFNCIRFFPHFSPMTATDLPVNDAVKKSSYYSPILNDIDVGLHDVKFNGTLWPPKDPAWSRLEPGDPETESLWQGFEPKDVFAITRADIIGLGKDPDLAVRYPDEYWGLGDDAYMAAFDSLHKTHCLNELRKMTFQDYGHYVETKKKHGRLWWYHLRHCVDMLMQDQICHADADIVTFTWVDTQSHPWADMSINRKCRSWDNMIQWGRDRFVNFDMLSNFTKPKEGVRVLPFERGYYEQFGFEGSDMFPNGTGYEW